MIKVGVCDQGQGFGALNSETFDIHWWGKVQALEAFNDLKLKKYVMMYGLKAFFGDF